MSIEKGELVTIVYEYDFAEDGGAISSIPLRAARSTTFEEGFIAQRMSLHVETAITSGGTPTMTLGDGTDPDGYAVDFFAAVGSANAVVDHGTMAGALIWDDTNDHMIDHRIGAAAADKALELAVGTATITGGKFKVYIHGYKPVV